MKARDQGETNGLKSILVSQEQMERHKIIISSADLSKLFWLSIMGYFSMKAPDCAEEREWRVTAAVGVQQAFRQPIDAAEFIAEIQKMLEVIDHGEPLGEGIASEDGFAFSPEEPSE